MSNKDTAKIWNGFISSMIHDIGKLLEFRTEIMRDLSKEGKSTSHENLQDYLELFGKKFALPPVKLPSDVLTLHKRKVEAGLEGVAMYLADRISKTIQGYPFDLENDQELTQRRSQDPQRFYSFWGFPYDWDTDHMITVFRKIYNYLTKNINVKDLLEMQKEMINFPHTSYIPHLSLAVHHQFTAIIYYLIISKLKELSHFSEFKEFKFSIIRVQPNFIDIFYRLRDVIICQKLSQILNRTIFRQIYSKFANDLQDIDPIYNPFVFYSEDSMVYIFDNYEIFKKELISSFSNIKGIRYIDVEHYDFELEIEWGPNVPTKINLINTPSRLKETLFSKNLFSFNYNSLVRCEMCQIPYDESFLRPDEKNNLICEDCLTLRNITSGIDFDKVSQSEEGEERIAFVFITFPDNLLQHAKDVADNILLPRFYERIGLQQKINATQTGMYEYLQMLLDLQRFDETLKDEINKMKVKKDEISANTLFIFPNLKVFLFREDKVWGFIGILNSERLKMQLEMGIKVIICDAKTPFWSLIEGALKHYEKDIFFDVSKEVVIVFTAKEVKDIRRLADLARNRKVWPTQIHNVSQVAMETTLDELLLEIDVRKDHLRGIENELKNSLQQLEPTNSEYSDREKRAVFLKYIANLSKR
ncbi:MAG: hypothetical protein ABIN61_08675 [candidate division WOR-3 bacterium]